MPEGTLPEQLRRLLPSFLAAREAQALSANTLDLNDRAVRRFITWLADERPSLHTLIDIDRHVIDDYALHLSVHESDEGRRLKASSRSIYLVGVFGLFRWLEDEGKILRNPCRGVHLPKIPKTLPRGVLSRKEVERVLRVPDLATPQGLRDRAILELLYASGIRNAELRSLELRDLDFAEGLITVRHGKGGKDRIVPMGTKAAHFLKRYLAEARPRFCRRPPEEHVFLARWGRPLAVNPLMRMVHEAGAAAGIRKPLTAHGLRHTCATHLLRGRADLRHIQELLGHRSLQATQIYTHVDASDLKRVHARCHPREQKP